MFQKIIVPLFVFIILALSVYIGINEYYTKERTITFAGQTRKYRVHIPKNFEKDKDFSLVIAIHGMTSAPRIFELTTGLSKKADHAGFIVAYPYGTQRKPWTHLTWNAGFCCDYAFEREMNDPDYILKLTEQLQDEFDISSEKTYLMGFSNGGMLASLVALRHPDKFAKVATISSAVGGATEDAETFKYLKKSYTPIPVLIIHGKQDNVIPFDGGVGMGGVFEFTAAYDSVNFWLENNKCSKHPNKISNQNNITYEIYSECENNTEVVFYAHNGKHVWPGGFKDFFKNLTGRNLNATNTMWTFFQK